MDELYHDILLPANLSHELDQAVYLILANKSDLDDVMSMEDITHGETETKSTQESLELVSKHVYQRFLKRKIYTIA